MAAPCAVQAQTTYETEGVYTPAPVPYLRVGSCWLPEGAYAKFGSTIRPDVEAENDGRCIQKWNGVVTNTFERWLLKLAKIERYTPTSGFSPYDYGTIWRSQNTHFEDSRNIDHYQWFSVGSGVSNVEGTHIFKFSTTSLDTICSITPTESPVIVRTVNVLKCKPVTKLAHIAQVAPGDTNKIYLPSSMAALRTDLDAAVAAWNLVLPSDLQWEVVTSSCGTGNHCVTITADSIPGLCGQTDTLSYPSDNLAFNMTLKLDTSWNSNTNPNTSAGNRRTLMHELGHLLGLADYPSCSDYEPSMYSPIACKGSTPAAVTVSDYLPALRTVYGGGNPAVCGWQ